MSPYNQFIQMSFLPFIWTNGGISCYGKLLTFYMMSKGVFHKVYFDNKIWTTKDERKGRGTALIWSEHTKRNINKEKATYTLKICIKRPQILTIKTIVLISTTYETPNSS